MIKYQFHFFLAVATILISCSTFQPEKQRNLHYDHTVFELYKLVPHANFFAYENQELFWGNELETGNKTDLRWIRLESDQLKLITTSTDHQLLNGSVWPFTTQELDFVQSEKGSESASGLVPVTSRHGPDIKTGGTVQWNIDHLQMGVGGDTSWGRLVHDEYTKPPKEYHYSFIINPTSK